MRRNLEHLKISLLWLLILLGFIIHTHLELGGLFFGIDIKQDGATGEVPIAAHIFRIAVQLPVLILGLSALYFRGKIFYRISFVAAVFLCVLNFVHFIETLTAHAGDYSQVLLTLSIFILNYMLVQSIYSLPWPLLPDWMKWKWAKHQRRWFGKWHLYIGIIAGGILCIVGVTGSILVFQDEIDRALNPEMFHVMETNKRIPLQEIIPIVKKKYPDKAFSYASVTNENLPNSTYRFRNIAEDTEFFINPYTAEISGKRIVSSSFIRIVMDIHRTLLIPKVGQYIVGLAALCLLILTISGLRLWIPQKLKQLKSVLTVNFNAGFKRQNYDWHNVLGFYSSPVVIVLSLTGFIITFNTVFIPLLMLMNGKSPNAVQQIFGNKSEYKKEYVQMPVNKVHDQIKLQLNDVQLEGVMMPADSVGTYMYYFRSKSEAKTGRLIMIVADQYTGKILLNSNTDFPASGQSYLSWTVPLHYGTFGGMPTRILALLGSLMPLALFITGFIIWWGRYKKQKKGSKTSSTKVVNIKKTKLELHHERLSHLPTGKYFVYYAKKGFKYAGILLPITVICGILYGAISGVVIGPGFYMFSYVSMAVLLNFLISVMVLLFNFIFLAPYGKSFKPIYKYFAYSTAFFIVFVPLCLLFFYSGWDVF